MSEGSIELLKQRLGMIIDACGEIQSALRTAEDRTDGAMVSLTHTAEDSANDDVTAALAELAKIKQGIEDYVGAAQTAADRVAAYRATR